MTVDIARTDPYSGTVTYGEPADIYYRRELDVANHSGLKVIGDKSAAHYFHYQQHPEDDEETDAKDFGGALHTWALEGPETFHRRYALLPEDHPARPTIRQINARKPSPDSIKQIDWWHNWRADHPMAIDIGHKDMQLIEAMTASLRAHVLYIPDTSGQEIEITCGELFDECETEVTMRWRNPRTGVKCKARADLSCRPFALGGDLKSCLDASPEGFAKAVNRYRYHQQSVHYTEGSEHCGDPLGWERFIFFCVEKTRPHVSAAYVVPPIGLERGDELRNRALDRLHRSLQTATWPPYNNRITELVLPAFAFYD